MTSRIPLIAAVLMAGSLTACSEGMSTVTSDEMESASAPEPSEIDPRGDSLPSTEPMSDTSGASEANSVPSPSTVGPSGARDVGPCEGTTCVGNDESTDLPGMDDTVSAQNN